MEKFCILCEGCGFFCNMQNTNLWNIVAWIQSTPTFCCFVYVCACLIQVTGASAENSRALGAPLWESPSLKYVNVHGALAATLYHISAFHEFVHIHCCESFALCVCVCVLTVILYDRMITPFSPELWGISQLHSPSSINPRGGTCANMYVNARFLWAAALLCISASPALFSSACQHHLRSLYDT